MCGSIYVTIFLKIPLLTLFKAMFPTYRLGLHDEQYSHNDTFILKEKHHSLKDPIRGLLGLPGSNGLIQQPLSP